MDSCTTRILLQSRFRQRSLYGLSVAPRLWFEHLRDLLLSIGLVQSTFDQCLFYGQDMICGVFVDDLAVISKTSKIVDLFVAKLRSLGCELTKEDSLCEYLGIKLVRNNQAGTFTLTQQGLIDKIVSHTGLTESNPNYTPATQMALGTDPDGQYMQEDWSYSSIVGMLLYLAVNTRPDIAYAVSQVARFNHSPKQSHAKAVKTIVRYLKGSRDIGTVMKPNGSLNLVLYTDADYAGLYKQEPDHLPTAVRSRTGYIIFLGSCPLVWKSQLQTEIALSTLEAEYCALSLGLKSLLPLKRLLIEAVQALSLPSPSTSLISAQACQDNTGAYYLATNQRLTNRTKHMLVKFHWFWTHYKRGEFTISMVKSEDQLADYFTKGLSKDVFLKNRKSVQNN